MMLDTRESRVDFVRRGDRIVGRLSDHTQIRMDEFAVGLFCRVPLLAADLLRVGLAIYSADRMVRRDWSHQSGGSRGIAIDIGVVEPDFWSGEVVTQLIRDALELLGSDVWEVRFHHQELETDYLACLPAGAVRVCEYSGGLDSAAGLARQVRANREPMLAVTACHQARQRRMVRKQLDQLNSRYGVDLHPVAVRTGLLKPPCVKDQEWSQRCRPFLFAALAGAVATSVGAVEVEVSESGIGAINLPLMHGMALGARTTNRRIHDSLKSSAS